MLQCMGLQRVGHDLATEQQKQHTHNYFISMNVIYWNLIDYIENSTSLLVDKEVSPVLPWCKENVLNVKNTKSKQKMGDFSEGLEEVSPDIIWYISIATFHFTHSL